MAFWTYIMASERNGTTYVGSTDNLYVRVLQHRDGTFDGHTSKHGCKRLVWAEEHGTRHDAFTRGRRIKEWRGSWKLMLIEEANPTWRDLFDEMFRIGKEPEEWSLRRNEAAWLDPPPNFRSPRRPERRRGV